MYVLDHVGVVHPHWPPAARSKGRMQVASPLILGQHIIRWEMKICHASWMLIRHISLVYSMSPSKSNPFLSSGRLPECHEIATAVGVDFPVSQLRMVYKKHQKPPAAVGVRWVWMLIHAASCVGVEFGFGAELKWTHHGIPQLKGTENKLEINVTSSTRFSIHSRNWVSHRRIATSPWAPVQVA